VITWGRTEAHDLEALLPDPPENPEFNELFTDAEQTEFTRRFHTGIETGRVRLEAARVRQAKSERIAFEARERSAARRSVLRSRP
jgi:hypothetical protein